MRASGYALRTRGCRASVLSRGRLSRSYKVTLVVEARGTAHHRGQSSRRRNLVTFGQTFLSRSALVKRGLNLGGPPSKAKYS
jgi:hypothetical protein